MVRTKDGKVVNNVVHTLSRPSDNEAYDITQEDLVVASLRFNPDIVCVGEMRDVECYSAVEASLTGHTVVSTVHASAADAAHMRIALLCQKRFPIDFKTSLMQAGQAFPIVVYTHKLENNERKIMDISECAYATYSIKLDTDMSDDEVRDELSGEMIINKKTKSGYKDVDISEFVKSVSVKDSVVEMTVCAACNRCLNPALAIGYLGDKVRSHLITRTGLYNEKMEKTEGFKP